MQGWGEKAGTASGGRAFAAVVGDRAAGGERRVTWSFLPSSHVGQWSSGGPWGRLSFVNVVDGTEENDRLRAAAPRGGQEPEASVALLERQLPTVAVLTVAHTLSHKAKHQGF